MPRSLSRYAGSLVSAASCTAVMTTFTVLPGGVVAAHAQTFTIQSITEIPAGPPVLPNNSRNDVTALGLSNNGTAALVLGGTNSAGRHLSGPQSANVGTLGASTRGLAVNDAGTVVGYGYPVANGPIHAFVSNNTGLTDLHTMITGLGGVGTGGESYATDINTSGQIVGHFSGTVRGSQDAYVMSADRTSLVNITAASVAAGGYRGGINYAAAINDAGQVVGQQGFLGEQGFGFAPRAYLYSGGAVTRLGVPTGASFSDTGSAFGLSENGQWIAGTYGTVAVRWQSNGTALTLGTLGGFNSTAYGVNSLGLVVGDSFGSAFIFQDGQLMNLNSLLPANSGWILRTATGINDANQIVGNGLYTNSQGIVTSSAYRLNLGNGAAASAAPEPGTLALLLPLLGGMGVAARRRRA